MITPTRTSLDDYTMRTTKRQRSRLITSSLIIGEISVSSIYRQNYLAAKHQRNVRAFIYRQNYFAALRRDDTDRIILLSLIIGDILVPLLYRQKYLAADHRRDFVPSLYRRNYPPLNFGEILVL